MRHYSDSSSTYVPRLRALRSRAERERTGTFYIEGTHIVHQALQAGATIELCVVAPDLLSSDQGWKVVAALRASGVPIVSLSASAFGSISFKENLQGIGAVVRSHVGSLSDLHLEPARNWVALDAVGNPGNLGAIFRTCEAVGCAGIILLGNTTEPFHPAAVRASTGALFSQQLVRASFEEFARWKQERSLAVVGTTVTAAHEMRAVSYPRPLVLLMGSERLGLSAAQQEICDLLVRIPMVGSGDSLNLAVAASVVLYEIFHQQRAT
jgi:RNA methyltransferase, TrmH family